MSFLICSPESTDAISSKMAALEEEVLVSDLMEMSVEELKERGWALRTARATMNRTCANILKRDQTQGPGEHDRRKYGETQVRALQAFKCLTCAHLDEQAISQRTR
jgi:hypothetical protein